MPTLMIDLTEVGHAAGANLASPAVGVVGPAFPINLAALDFRFAGETAGNELHSHIWTKPNDGQAGSRRPADQRWTFAENL